MAASTAAEVCGGAPAASGAAGEAAAASAAAASTSSSGGAVAVSTAAGAGGRAPAASGAAGGAAAATAAKVDAGGCGEQPPRLQQRVHSSATAPLRTPTGHSSPIGAEAELLRMRIKETWARGTDGSTDEEDRQVTQEVLAFGDRVLGHGHGSRRDRRRQGRG